MKTILGATIVLALVALSLQNQCTKHKDCSSCASDNCSWCAETNDCHMRGSLVNKCGMFERVTTPKLCTCTRQPGQGVDRSACSWYTTRSASLPTDTALWTGGDFLPHSYYSAAKCACEGGSSTYLWNTPAAKCVRRMVLEGHRLLPAILKQQIRAITLSGDKMKLTPFVPAFVDIHKIAYETCGCSGTPAARWSWDLVMQFGDIPSCDFMIAGILEKGRCGCGW
jgi:hypothetical protein